MKSTTTLSAEVLQVFETVPNMYLILSPDLYILTASDLYLEATQTTREKLVGRHIFEAFPDNPDIPDADGVKNINASLKRVLATRKPDQMPVQHYDVPDPARPGMFLERYWLPSHTPVLDEQGEVSYIIQLATNITDTIRANHQLKASQDREIAALAEVERQRTQLQTIIEQAPIALAFLKGDDHRIESANPQICQLWGRQQADVLGRPLWEVLPETRGQGFEEALEGVLRTDIPFEGRELPAQLERRGVLETVYFNFVYQPLYNGQGVSIGILIAANDVSEQVLARQKVEQSEQALQALNQEIAATNEELRAANEEIHAANEELLTSQQELLRLNVELEERVIERTAQLRQALQVTEQQKQQLQEQLQERETLYQVFEQTPAAICIQQGPAHRYRYVNPAYQALFPDRTFVGLSVAEALPETVPQGFVSLLDGVYRMGETFFGQEMPVTLTRPDGSPLRTIYFNFTYQAYREKGEIVGISTFAYDVTEQVLARREAERHRHLLHTLFMEAPAAICILDGQDLIYELVNPTYQQLFPGRALQGKPIAEALPELANHDVLRTFRQVYQTGITHREQGILIPIARPEDGQLEDRYFNYIQQARLNMDGEIDGVLVFAFEVTDQVQSRQQAQAIAKELSTANEELQMANERLRRSNVDLDTFVYSASHDLKSPVISLDALLGRLATRLAHKLDDREQEMVTLIQSSSQRLQQTIRDLTQIAQVQRDVQQEKTLIHFKEVLSEIQADLASQLEESGAQLVVDFGVESLAYTRKNLRSILYNLLSNAIKYRSPQRVPQILIRTHPQEDRTVLIVSDNGLGLTEPQRQGMFAMFKRFHIHVEGSGVGLYTIKRIIENYGGEITVDSQLGQGTTFRIQF